ncbi:MAG: outer membrane protein assembly factor BamE, partial [Proteobacteria bacterium]
MRGITIALLLFSSSLLSACQTNMLKEYDSLHAGMEKDDVLDKMGSPQRTQRARGKDRWTYVFYHDRIRYEKEVQFFEGTAVYVGDAPQPAESAIQADAKNEAANKAVEEDIAKKYQD